MSKHTPGPWTYHASLPEDGSECWWFRGTDKYGTNFEIGSVNGPQRECSEANARLIAAAPDLLEALRMAMCYVSNEGSEEEYQQARAAIAKATGEQQ